MINNQGGASAHSKEVVDAAKILYDMKGGGLKKKKTQNPWIKFLTEYRKKHKQLSLKDAMLEAKLLYNRNKMKQTKTTIKKGDKLEKEFRDKHKKKKK